jgi:DNA-binding CsgD family transcriptional regulator
MQRPASPIDGSFKATRDLVIMFGLLFFTWSLAALSVHPLDAYFVSSLVPALGLAALAYRLWSSLQHERDLRRQAEAMLGRRPLMQAEIASATVQARENAALTEREQEVLTLIASSCTNQAVAEVLSISLNTVERHIANVYRKLGVRGRIEATHYAVRHGLVTEESLERCREAGTDNPRGQA